MNSLDKTTRKLAAIMFADIVGYSRMMGENETLTVNLIQEYENIVTPIIENYNGKILKKMGDGLFCEFSSALEAVDCANQMHSALDSYNQTKQHKFLLTIRVGIHLGDVVTKGDDLYGDGVNVAARIEPIAPPGGICISQSIHSVISNHSKYEFVSLGKRTLKNIKRMHNLYLVKTGYEIEKTPKPSGGESILVGQVIDNYEIVKVLGYGGMGTVFKAIDQNLEKEVALKLMDSRLSNDKEFINRFRTEGKSQALLQHPNIVAVHTLRGTDLGMFLVMEYVEGETLGRKIQSSGSISWQNALPIFKQIISAIEHAHSKGVIHRDIKPNNVIIDVTGKVKITDFGLARVQHDFGVTKTGYSGGTFVYSAPEQIKDFKKADNRSDIYSIGMTFYEVLAGKLPFDPTESNLTIQLKILEGNITPLHQLNPNLPHQLIQIVNKAIHKDPDKRYQSAGAMLGVLDDFEKDSSAPIAPQVEKPFKRSYKPFYITALSIILILLIGYYLNVPEKIKQLFTSSTPPVKTKSTLKINSEPIGALVFLGNNEIGSTPVEYTIGNDDDLNIKIAKEGYIAIDTVITANVENEYLSFKLKPLIISKTKEPVKKQPEPEREPPKQEKQISPLPKTEVKLALGRITLNTQPFGASIWLDGQKIENALTPYSLENIKAGKHTITLRKDGYQDFSTTVNVEQNQGSVISETLIAQKGIIKILVRPWGSIFVDGELKKKGTSTPYEISIPAGTHRIRVVHPTLGQWGKNIEIRGNIPREYVVDFNLQVELVITSEPNFCKIFIDGKSTDKYTPKKINLRTGIHAIRVEKDGYISEEKKINVDKTLEKPIHFQLKKSR
jgi:serine/threonine protein kinase/class 3 adenylate cyclase